MSRVRMPFVTSTREMLWVHEGSQPARGDIYSGIVIGLYLAHARDSSVSIVPLLNAIPKTFEEVKQARLR
jgi:hypothetical protein